MLTSFQSIEFFDLRYNFFASGFDPISNPQLCKSPPKSSVLNNPFGTRDLPNTQCCGSSTRNGTKLCQEIVLTPTLANIYF